MEYTLQSSPIRTRHLIQSPVPGYAQDIWTPTISFADVPGDQSISYNTNVGRYVLFGKNITLFFNIVTSVFTYTTASGNLYVLGIPFNVANFSRSGGYGHCDFQGITAAGFTQLGVVASQNQSKLTFQLSGSGQALTALTDTSLPSG